eukprot:3152508-Lingulodinium_polyedra.AAC.1
MSLPRMRRMSKCTAREQERRQQQRAAAAPTPAARHLTGVGGEAGRRSPAAAGRGTRCHARPAFLPRA